MRCLAGAACGPHALADLTQTNALVRLFYDEDLRQADIATFVEFLKAR
jgi:hypothetical protein